MKSQHRRGPWRAPWATALVVAALTSSIIGGGHAGAGNGLTSDQVADQIIAVQDDADAVAAKLADLDAESQDLAAQIATTQVDVDAAQARYDQLQQDLQAIALSKYTGAIPQSNLPFSGSIMNDVQTDALTGFALGSGQVDLGDVGAAQRDLDREQQHLATLQGRNDRAREQLSSTQDALNDKITNLTALEDKLHDAEVKKAYEAKLAEKRRRDEAAAAALAAKTQATAPPATQAVARGDGATPSTPTTAITQPATTATATTAPANDAAPGTTRPTTTEAPDTTATRTTEAPTTTDAPAPVVITSDLVCPVAGTHAFGDTWGASRSGGRHHEGTDIISPYGTPLVAMDDGFAQMKHTSLGGNSIGLKATDGTYYFYAHLSSFEGGSRNVSKGEVIGYVGHTGDTTVNHLHIEIHPGGGAAVNPYPTIRRIC